MLNFAKLLVRHLYLWPQSAMKRTDHHLSEFGMEALLQAWRGRLDQRTSIRSTDNMSLRLLRGRYISREGACLLATIHC